MDKLNGNVDIAPTDRQNRKNTNTDMFKPLRDNQLALRIKEYLASHKESSYVDVTEMAEYLQAKYREYNRRKKKAFRTMVQVAYSSLLQQYSIGNDSSSSDESEVISPETENQRKDHLNDSLVAMYHMSQSKSAGHNESIQLVQQQELIDISSDDSNEADTSKQPTKQQNLQNILTNFNKEEIKENVEDKAGSAEKPENDKLLMAALNGNNVRKRKSMQQNHNFVSSKRKRELPIVEPTVTFKDLGGIDNVLIEVCQLLMHFQHPEVYRQIGTTSPRGFLLHGPPGSGKTLLAHAISGELEVPMIKVAAPELVAGVSGESEERIRDLFEQAVSVTPCIVFIDEIDAITPNRQFAQREMERRIVAQLISCLDDLGQHENGDSILVIGATNRPDSLDPALRRAGRFDREISLGIPDSKSRAHILRVLCSKLKLSNDFNFEYIATCTPGFVGADLVALVQESVMAAVSRTFTEIKKSDVGDDVILLNESKRPRVETDTSASTEIDILDQKSDASDIQSVSVVNPTKPKTLLEDLIASLHDENILSVKQLSKICIEMEDVKKALKCVQPSAKREGFATVPDVTWEDVGSLKNIREELQMSILAPVRHADKFESLGLTSPTGVLLCGPPGCGKTLLAKAIANEAGINFISVKGPELLNMYVGESERAVRLCFQRARNSQPCVIFFDEIDSLCPKRSDSSENSSTMRVVNQMLTEMDGVEGRRGVYLMAASNRPDIIDPAVLRPGRLDKILYVGIPTPNDRVDILRTITKNGTRPALAPDVDLNMIGLSNQCSGYTGADLAALVREAGIQALRQYMIQENETNFIDDKLVITTVNFGEALKKIRPSISDKDHKHYEKLEKLYSVSLSATSDEMEDVPMEDS